MSAYGRRSRARELLRIEEREPEPASYLRIEDRLGSLLTKRPRGALTWLLRLR